MEIFPAQSNDTAVRVEFFGDEVDRISEFNPLTGEIKADLKHIAIYPASHYIVPQGKNAKRLFKEIEQELEERLAYFAPGGESCWRPSVLSKEPGMILKCFRKSAFARELKTIPESWRDGNQAARRLRFWIIFQKTTCCLWTSPM